MKKVLIIAYVFPPIAYAGTHRTLRLCRHLSQMGYSIDVLTIDIQDDLHNDFQLLRSIEKAVKIVRTPIRDPYRVLRKLKKRLRDGFAGRLINGVVSRAVQAISKPDHMVFWLVNAFRPALKMVTNQKYDIVYTTSPPHSEQLIGYLLKRLMPSIKWVADLRDPLIDNIMIHQIGTIDKLVLRWLEGAIAKYADAVIFNTTIARKRFEMRYEKKKSHLIRNSYDESNFGKSVPPFFDKFTISHVGSIYAFRNVDILFGVVAKLVEKKQIEPKTFRLLFVGMNDPSLQSKAKQFNIERFVEIQGMVPHQEAVEIMHRSHLLLLVKGFGKNSNSQIPGKLFEYLATGNSIVHVGPLQSEAADIIKIEKAGHTFSDDNPKALANYINDRYQLFLSDPQLYSTERPVREKFSSKIMAQKMRLVFQEAVK